MEPVRSCGCILSSPYWCVCSAMCTKHTPNWFHNNVF